MPVTNVTSAWVSGNLVFYDVSGNIIVTYDGTNRKLSLPSGSTLESLGTTTITDATLSPNDLSLAQGSVLVGDSGAKAVALVAKTDTAILIGNGTTVAAKTISGDASLANTGALTISAKAVENTMIAAAAGTVLVGTKTSGDVTALDISAEGAMALGQGAGNTAAAYAMSGDVTMTKGGVTAIGATKVTSAMLASGAGVAALLTAGLGGSHSVLKTEADTHTIVAAHGSKDRACLALVVVDEAYAVGTGTLPTVALGETGTIEKAMAATVLDTEAAGTVLAFAFTNTATKAIIATTTAAIGNSTGGCSITVIGIPTT
jgi:hypothetical protein